MFTPQLRVTIALGRILLAGLLFIDKILEYCFAVKRRLIEFMLYVELFYTDKSEVLAAGKSLSTVLKMNCVLAIFLMIRVTCSIRLDEEVEVFLNDIDKQLESPILPTSHVCVFDTRAEHDVMFDFEYNQKYVTPFEKMRGFHSPDLLLKLSQRLAFRGFPLLIFRSDLEPAFQLQRFKETYIQKCSTIFVILSVLISTRIFDAMEILSEVKVWNSLAQFTFLVDSLDPFYHQ